MHKKSLKKEKDSKNILKKQLLNNKEYKGRRNLKRGHSRPYRRGGQNSSNQELLQDKSTLKDNKIIYYYYNKLGHISTECRSKIADKAKGNKEDSGKEKGQKK